MSDPFTKDNSVLQYSFEKSRRIDFKFDQMSDIHNIRSRHSKSNTSTGSISKPAHFILSTGDFQSNEKDNDIRYMIRNKHNFTQIIFMVFTAISYLLHTLRAYIPATMQTDSHFWSSLVTRPITRVYTSDLRPNILIENLLFRLIENWQTFWLIYVLSFIPRRTNFGYLYRNPNIFNSCLCFLFIIALLFQIASQLSLSSEVSCACLYISLIFLIINCRLIAVKLFKYENLYKSTSLSIDLAIIRYFVLNSLFLYTILIAYATMCATIEYIGMYLDLHATVPISINICTTIGLSIILFLLVMYFFLDQFIYKNEFWSIWTPYLFIIFAFIGPPLRQLSFFEIDVIQNDLNYYLYWILCSITILILSIRLFRQIFVICCRTTKKKSINSHTEQVTS
ncbi:unnamed protein product [Rotaria sp. Silwood1]|nr:unnamed protein product [Rotaria sp. Silwood1]CAF3713814.1 unnamed protein product [Rotaria sp. Silwood1]CAF3756028.1 unnamed protein product [Rotaria sp. Silwood1]CAF4914883.1 unnamed protein product [Rotaria sp. Silwood1]CAF4964216.1 unnamed protein product [Rotaria sp. Silwood1]